MNKDQENSDSGFDSQVPSENSSAEDIKFSDKKDRFFKSKQPAESDNEKLTDEGSATKKNFYGKKAWLFLLFLIMTIGVGGYFYSQKKEIDLLKTLPSDLNKSFPFTTKTHKSLATQPKRIPIEPTPKFVEQAEKPGTLEKPISENEKTINLLRDEIRYLKIELKQKNSPPSTQNVRNVIPHISGGVARGKTEELTEKAEEESEPEMEISFIPSPPIKVEPTFKQSQDQKTSPQRSKEVQAYLDFVEDTANKVARLIKELSNRLLALVL